MKILRIVLGAIVGAVLWIFLLITTNTLLTRVMPDWYVAQQTAIDQALNAKSVPYAPSTSYLLVAIASMAMVGLMSGFVSAFVSDRSLIAAALSGLPLMALMAVGFSYTSLVYPSWYVIVILGVMIPASIVGCRLRGK